MTDSDRFNGWLAWATVEFNGDVDRARRAARAATEAEEIGASRDACRRAAFSAASAEPLATNVPVLQTIRENATGSPTSSTAAQAQNRTADISPAWFWLAGVAIVALVVLGAVGAYARLHPAQIQASTSSRTVAVVAPSPSTQPSPSPTVALPSPLPPPPSPTPTIAPRSTVYVYVPAPTPRPTVNPYPSPQEPTGQYNNAVSWLNFSTLAYDSYVTNWNAMSADCYPYGLACVGAVTSTMTAASTAANTSAKVPACMNPAGGNYVAGMTAVATALAAELTAIHNYGYFSTQVTNALAAAVSANNTAVKDYQALTLALPSCPP